MSRLIFIVAFLLACPAAALAETWRPPVPIGDKTDATGVLAFNEPGYAAYVSGLREQHAPTRALTLRIAAPDALPI